MIFFEITCVHDMQMVFMDTFVSACLLLCHNIHQMGMSHTHNHTKLHGTKDPSWLYSQETDSSSIYLRKKGWRFYSTHKCQTCRQSIQFTISKGRLDFCWAAFYSLVFESSWTANGLVDKDPIVSTIEDTQMCNEIGYSILIQRNLKLCMRNDFELLAILAFNSSSNKFNKLQSMDYFSAQRMF